MRLFLDANILVAVLNKEYPLFPYAARVIGLADHPQFTVYTSPVCLAIAFYLVEMKSGTRLARHKISLLSEKLKITPMEESTVQKTLNNPSITDFEDGLEYYAAEAVDAQCIITEAAGDFFFSNIEVAGARQFLEKYFVG